MHAKTHQAFTAMEMIFVIVVIGILSAIAIPKFTTVSVSAYDSKASSTLAVVRSALATERQRRILRGDFNPITSLGNVFTKFSEAADGSAPKIMDNPPKVCSSGDNTACWSNDGNDYIYHFADGGSAAFALSNNKLLCKSGSDCTRLEP